MTKTVAVYSMKGGVGKTTLAVNLAYCSAASSNCKTLLWDIDAQGGASFILQGGNEAAKAMGVFTRDIPPSKLVESTKWPKLDLLAADLSLRHLDQALTDEEKPKRLRKLLKTLAPDYDRIVLDCPPGLGEVSDQIFRAADLIIVPVPPTPLAHRSLMQIEDHLKQNHDRNPQVLPVISMVDRRRKLHREFVAEHPDWPAIPGSSLIERMAVARGPLAAYASGSAAAKLFEELWVMIDGILVAMPEAKAHVASRKLVRIPSSGR